MAVLCIFYNAVGSAYKQKRLAMLQVALEQDWTSDDIRAFLKAEPDPTLELEAADDKDPEVECPECGHHFVPATAKVA